MHAVIAGGGIAGPALGVALTKVGVDATILEARRPEEAGGGAFLNLAPNGINALRAIGLGEVVRDAGGVPRTGIRFHNAAGREVGHLDGRDELARYGAQNHLIRRDLLHERLHEAAEAAGVTVVRGARVTEVDERRDGVRVRTTGTHGVVEGDVLLGADGVHSTVRRQVVPDAERPHYTGILNCGGWTAVDLPDTPDQQLVFGRRGFFGYVVHDGLAYWFSNVAHREDPSAGQGLAIDTDAWLGRIRQVHADDPEPVGRILSAATGVAGVWPVYDVAALRTWHTGRVCLLGDAAHATSPNAGQGASLAFEDAAELARCLRDLREPAAAFAAFERLRKDRAEKIVRLSRRLGKSKAPSRLGAWFRDLTLPHFLKAGASETREKYGYVVDFDAPVPGTPQGPRPSGVIMAGALPAGRAPTHVSCKARSCSTCCAYFRSIGAPVTTAMANPSSIAIVPSTQVDSVISRALSSPRQRVRIRCRSARHGCSSSHSPAASSASYGARAHSSSQSSQRGSAGCWGRYRSKNASRLSARSAVPAAIAPRCSV